MKLFGSNLRIKGLRTTEQGCSYFLKHHGLFSLIYLTHTITKQGSESDDVSSRKPQKLQKNQLDHKQ